jgi:hypothetical protein
MRVFKNNNKEEKEINYGVYSISTDSGYVLNSLNNYIENNIYSKEKYKGFKLIKVMFKVLNTSIDDDLYKITLYFEYEDNDIIMHIICETDFVAKIILSENTNKEVDDPTKIHIQEDVIENINNELMSYFKEMSFSLINFDFNIENQDNNEEIFENIKVVIESKND